MAGTSAPGGLVNLVVKRPRGTVTRWKLFDTPWDGGKDRLIGQEEVQARVYRAIAGFVRDGRVSCFILLHGFNGFAKSMLIRRRLTTS